MKKQKRKAESKKKTFRRKKKKGEASWMRSTKKEVGAKINKGGLY